MKVFVAGATGVIGRALLPRILEAGHTVTGMTRDAGRAKRLSEIGVTPAVCDVYDLDGLQKAVRAASPDVVVHQLTALPNAIDPRRAEEQLTENSRIRIEGTRNLIEAAQEAGVPRMVAQSIAFVYEPTGGPVKTEDDPLWVNSIPEMAGTVDAVVSLEQQVTEAADMAGVVLRYGFFYGPGSAYDLDGSIADLVRTRQMPIAGGGNSVFSFIHVDDAAIATVAALTKGRAGVYNIVDDEPQRMRDWLPLYAEAIGAPAPRRVPGFLARMLAGRYGHYLLTRMRGASNERAKRELDWSPRYPALQAGLAQEVTKAA